MERKRGNATANRGSGLLLLTLVLLALAPGTALFAQNATPTATSTAPGRAKRVVLVSILDRKLAVLEDGDVIATFPIAVGAAASPSPTGEFQIVSRVSNPTYYHAGHGDSEREGQSPGHALGGT